MTLCLGEAHPRVAFAPDSPRGVRYLGAARRSTARKLDTSSAPWRANGWHAGECLSYAADVGAVADLRSDSGTRFGRNLVTDPQHWLVRASVQAERGAEVVVTMPEGWSVSAPWHEVEHEGSVTRFVVPDTPADWSASLVLGPDVDAERVEFAGGTLRIAMLFKPTPAQRENLLAWLRRVGEALLTAYGRMPLPDVQVTIVSLENTGLAFRFFAFLHPSAVLGGESARGQGNALQLVVDPRRPAREFADDWTAIHELSHLMHPYLGDRGSWLAEGLATYYQNVLRARDGLLTQTQAWERLASGFQRGAQASSARPLEQAASDMQNTHEFTRVYWAGAAYWFSVDAELRRATSGKLGLDAILARFSDCCLPSAREWPPEAFVARLDALGGTRVFSHRYREFARMSTFPDWEKVFASIGLRVKGESVLEEATEQDAGFGRQIMARSANGAASDRADALPAEAAGRRP